MKKIKALLFLGMAVLVVSTARAEVTFDVNQGYQMFNDARFSGTDRRFDIGFGVGGDVLAGFYMEEGLWNWRADVGAAAPNFVNLSARINGIRVLKEFGKFLSAGVGLGTAEITVRAGGGTTATTAAAAPLSQTKPVLDILGRAEYNVASGQGMTSGLHLDLGYRFLDLNDVTTAGVLSAAGSGERTIDDLNAFVLSIGLQVKF